MSRNTESLATWKARLQESHYLLFSSGCETTSAVQRVFVGVQVQRWGRVRDVQLLGQCCTPGLREWYLCHLPGLMWNQSPLLPDSPEST
eukprot:1301575-Amphidinium_carterae.1